MHVIQTVNIGIDDRRNMAEKKKHLRMRGVKQASKRLEDDVLGRSKDIAENPGTHWAACPASSGSSLPARCRAIMSS